MKKMTPRKIGLAFILIAGLILGLTGAAQASLYADVLCYFEVGANQSYTSYPATNAVSVDGVTAPAGFVNLGNWTDDATQGMGYTTGLVVGFSTSIANGTGVDLYIPGVGSMAEPAIIEVAIESSGSGATADGWMDETFYLLKPSNYDSLPWDPRVDAIPGGYFPYSMSETGYADVYGYSEMEIDWAIDMNGNYVSLTSIAYVRIRSASDAYSSEVLYVEALNGTAAVPVPAAVWLFGSGLIGVFGLRRRVHRE